MKNLRLIFLSFIVFSSFAQNTDNELRQEVEEFMKSREQLYNQIIQDNSVFDDSAKALIKKLMNNHSITNFNGEENKLKFKWESNTLWIFDLTDEDEIQISVAGEEVKISGKHFVKINNEKVIQNIRQSIFIPKSIKFKSHKVEFISPNFKISFN